MRTSERLARRLSAGLASTGDRWGSSPIGNASSTSTRTSTATAATPTQGAVSLDRLSPLAERTRSQLDMRPSRSEPSVLAEWRAVRLRQPGPVQVEVSHFVDAGERDDDGLYEYYFEGDVHVRDQGERIDMCTYQDDPESGFFVGRT